MTPAEASNYLGLSNYEDLDEAVEMNLFQCRQELIQKADHILLFPAKEKRLKLFQVASEKLGFIFEQIAQSEEIDGSPSNQIEVQFHCFQANRSRLLKKAGQVKSFTELVQLQEQLKRNYQIWSMFWNDMKSINPQEVKLSEIVDSMRFLQVINQWKEQGLEEIHQLGSADIPMDIQLEILRLQQISEKLS